MKKQFKKIYIEITNNCNLHCSFCTNNRLLKQALTTEQFENIVLQIKNYTDYVYLHVKGEPLIHEKLFEFLEILQFHKLKTNLTTNGLLLKNKIPTLFSYDIYQINVSLHSIIKFSLEMQTEYLNNLAHFIEENEQKKKFYVSIRIWNDEQEVCEQLLNRLMKILKIKKLTHTFISKEKQFTWPSLSDSIISDQGTCKGGITHIAILANGEVTLCCLDSLGINSMGNIFETPFSAIISNFDYVNIITNFKNKKIVCDLCKRCSYRLKF